MEVRGRMLRCIHSWMYNWMKRINMPVFAFNPLNLRPVFSVAEVEQD
jgi:hypothetical protein